MTIILKIVNKHKQPSAEIYVRRIGNEEKNTGIIDGLRYEYDY